MVWKMFCSIHVHDSEQIAYLNYRPNVVKRRRDQGE